MSLSNPVVSAVTRRRVIEAANKLARSNTITVEAYEELLNAVGQQFSEDFGVNCKVIISCDKAALLKKVDELEKEGK
jgi:hypothetical protein